jgi:hypothetical protein
MEIPEFIGILTASTMVGFGLGALFSFLGYIIRGIYTTIFDYRP